MLTDWCPRPTVVLGRQRISGIGGGTTGGPGYGRRIGWAPGFAGSRGRREWRRPKCTMMRRTIARVRRKCLDLQGSMGPGSASALLPDLCSAVFGNIEDYRQPGMMALLEKRFCVCTFHAQSPSTRVWIELDSGRTRGLSKASGLCFFSRWEVVSCWPKNNRTERLFGFPTE
jgi:hypothetical protein